MKHFIFEEILELYDLKWRGFNITNDHCNRFHIMPRFCRTLPYNGKELLSPSEIIKYFLSNNKPVMTQQTLSECRQMSNREWLNYVEPMQGSIVTCPGKRPSSIRLDQLDRDQLMSNDKKTAFPLIIHFSMFLSFFFVLFCASHPFIGLIWTLTFFLYFFCLIVLVNLIFVVTSLFQFWF